jgi:hypothetical protein
MKSKNYKTPHWVIFSRLLSLLSPPVMSKYKYSPHHLNILHGIYCFKSVAYLQASHNVLLPLEEICVQRLKAFSFCRLDESYHGTNNYTMEQRTVVSVWIHDRPQTGKTMKRCGRFPETIRARSPSKTDTSVMETKYLQQGA